MYPKQLWTQLHEYTYIQIRPDDPHRWHEDKTPKKKTVGFSISHQMAFVSGTKLILPDRKRADFRSGIFVYIYYIYIYIYFLAVCVSVVVFKENLNASRPSEHPPAVVVDAHHQ